MIRLVSIVVLLIFVSCGAYADDECHIIYGIFDNYKPYEWMDSGKAKGINIDILDAMTKEAGCSYEVVSGSWTDMLHKLKDGKIDLMTVSPNKITDKFAIYIPQSLVNSRYIFYRANAKPIKTVDELRGKTVLVIKDSFSDDSVTQIQKEFNLKILRYPTHIQALIELSRGSGDAFISTMVATLNAMQRDSAINVKSSSYPIFTSPYGFAVRKQNVELFNRINKAMNSLMESGKYFEIQKKWAMNQDKYALLQKYLLIAAGVALLVFLIIMLWNKSLYLTVQKKTKSLNNEIAVRKEAQEALTKSSEKYISLSGLFQMVLDNLPEQIYLFNQDIEIAWTNFNPDKLVNPLRISTIQDKIEQVLHNRENVRIDKLSDDAQSWSVHILLLDQPVTPILVVISNITENVRLRDEALMSSRMAALGEMAAAVAHEINNPTGLIIHNFDFIKQVTNELFDQVDSEEAANLILAGLQWDNAYAEARESFDMIGVSLSRIKDTIASLKKFNKVQSDEYSWVDLKECIDNTVKMTDYFIKSYTKSFSVDIQEPVYKIYGSRMYLEQALVNLIQNACHALTDRSQNIVCSLSATECRRYMRLAVTDSGRGMTPDIVEKSCNAFFTTRKSSGGSGLGLAITTRIVREHHGYMNIDSEPGKGTTVSLYFPINKKEESE